MPRHFIIGGAQRSATTYLYKLLDQHPSITMARPMRPEPKYFIRPDYKASLASYHEACFAEAPAEAEWLGEKSTSYIEHPIAAERIAALIPDAFIIFVLRDPVERAISNYHFSAMHGLETLPLAEALAAEQGRASSSSTSVSPFAYVERGMYARHLEPWFKRFPSQQILLLTTERITCSAAAVNGVFTALSLQSAPALAGIGAPVNAAPTAGTVPASIREWLQAQFREANRDLSERYAVDVGDWQ